MKKFSNLNENVKKYGSKNNLKNQIFDILETLDIKVSGKEAEKLSNIDINIEGKEEITEKLKELIDSVRIQERKQTLNVVKSNSFNNFNMNWLNEEIEKLDKINTSFVLNEKIKDAKISDDYRDALVEYFVNNLNGKTLFDGWEFEHESPGIFNFTNKTKNLIVKSTPFWDRDDKIDCEVYDDDDEDHIEPIFTDTLNFNIEEILYKKYLEVLEKFINILSYL